MSLARIKGIAAAAEAACNAVIADLAKPELREQLFRALAEVADPSFTPDEQSAEMVGLCRQASVWAQIVRERIVFARAFSTRPGNRSGISSIGLAHNIRQLLEVLDSIKNKAAAGE